LKLSINTRIGAYTDKFHKWRCIFQCRQLEQEIDQKHTLSVQLINQSLSTLANEGLPYAKCYGLLMSPIQRREARRIKSQHVCITWILWPTNMQNRVQTAWTPGTALRTHLTTTMRKHKGSRDHRGRPTPQVGRTYLVAANSLLPRGVSWLALESIPGLLGVFSHRCSGL
jgi:hypothetical protein